MALTLQRAGRGTTPGRSEARRTRCSSDGGRTRLSTKTKSKFLFLTLIAIMFDPNQII
jgi:hypothetical protein